MCEKGNNQSFNVDDIRRIRNENEKRYKGMTQREISNDIHQRDQEGWAIIEKIRQEKKLSPT